MTEESYQQARTVMQKANGMRGMIAKRKGEVAKWSKIQDTFREQLREAQADGAKKMLDIAMKKLALAKEAFAKLKFPENNIHKQYIGGTCKVCSATCASGSNLCGECTELLGLYNESQ